MIYRVLPSMSMSLPCCRRFETSSSSSRIVLYTDGITAAALLTDEGAGVNLPVLQ
jgi:hypothetical protein